MKKEIYLDTTGVGILDERPPKEDRPVCLNCKRVIPMRSSRWHGPSNIPWDQRPKKWYYAGYSFFCHRECAGLYAWKAAKKELGIEDINNLN